MQEVNIPLTIRGIGKGRSAMSTKDKEVDGALVQFGGDPGAIFLSRGEFWELLNLKGAMQAQANGAAPRKEAGHG
jgi:hypothetical protein